MNAGDIKKIAIKLGADLCGIAPVHRFKNAPQGFHPQDILSECKSVIVLAIRFPVSTLQANSYIPYTFVRNMMVGKIDTVVFELANKIEALGIQAVPIPSADPYEYWDADNRVGKGIISLKHAGVLAGLGKMGKNTLLINNKLGNMMWLGALLVSKDLEPDPLAEYEVCKNNCRLCLDGCVKNALDGITINQLLCRSKSTTSTEGGGWYLSCNTCRKICPNYLGID